MKTAGGIMYKQGEILLVPFPHSDLEYGILPEESVIKIHACCPSTGANTFGTTASSLKIIADFLFIFIFP